MQAAIKAGICSIDWKFIYHDFHRISMASSDAQTSWMMESRLSPLVLNIWRQYISDPFVSMDAVEVLEVKHSHIITVMVVPSNISYVAQLPCPLFIAGIERDTRMCRTFGIKSASICRPCPG